MGKSSHFYGQSVFGQLVSLISRDDANKIARECNSDRFCKGFTSWNHLLSMLFSTMGNCHSLREVSAAFLGSKGKLEQWGMQKVPKRSTLSDANRKRSSAFFEKMYYKLLANHRNQISDSRMRQMFGKSVMIFDSTTISLFQAVWKCVGRKPASGREKGGVKVHTILNADDKVPEVIWISDASTHDSAFYDKIKFRSDALYVFDKGYTDNWRFDEWTKEGVHFVTRIRDNATFRELEEIEIADFVDPGVIKDQWIEIPLRDNGTIKGRTRLRRVAYWDNDQNRLIVFLTNTDEMDGGQIAALYKCRWQVESLYKQLKQNFTLKYFLGDNQNAISIQIWCTLIVNLLLTVIREKVKRSWSFSNIVTFIRLHLFNHIHIIRFFENPEKDWEKEYEEIQMNMFSG